MAFLNWLFTHPYILTSCGLFQIYVLRVRRRTTWVWVWRNWYSYGTLPLTGDRLAHGRVVAHRWRLGRMHAGVFHLSELKVKRLVKTATAIHAPSRQMLNDFGFRMCRGRSARSAGMVPRGDFTYTWTSKAMHSVEVQYGFDINCDRPLCR